MSVLSVNEYNNTIKTWAYCFYTMRMLCYSGFCLVIRPPTSYNGCPMIYCLSTGASVNCLRIRPEVPVGIATVCCSTTHNFVLLLCRVELCIAWKIEFSAFSVVITLEYNVQLKLVFWRNFCAHSDHQGRRPKFNYRILTLPVWSMLKRWLQLILFKWSPRSPLRVLIFVICTPSALLQLLLDG